MDNELERQKKAQGARLKQAREHLGIKSAAETAKRFHWKENTYKAHEAGKRGLGIEAAQKYAAKLNVEWEWLMSGKNPPSWFSKGGVSTKRQPARSFPLLSWVAVDGYLSYPNEQMRLDVLKSVQVDADDMLGRRTFFLPIEGDTMVAKPQNTTDSFSAGDLAGFDPDADYKPGDFVLAKVRSEPLPLFRKYQLRIDEDGSEVADLVPLNSDYPVVRLGKANPGKIIAKLVRHIKKY